MGTTLTAKLKRKDDETALIEIRRDDFEAFCDAVGLYRKGFLEALDASERDHRAGRVTRRKSLRELMKDGK